MLTLTSVLLSGSASTPGCAPLTKKYGLSALAGAASAPCARAVGASSTRADKAAYQATRCAAEPARWPTWMARRIGGGAAGSAVACTAAGKARSAVRLAARVSIKG